MRSKNLLLAIIMMKAYNVWASSTLTYCSEGSPSGFDPGQYTGGTEFDAVAQTVFNRLLQFQKGSTQVEAALAERWSRAPDGLSYTFWLRKGVSFHGNEYFKPTREFNADDVVFTFERMLNINHPFRKAYPTDFPYFADTGMKENLLKVEKTDPMTVRFVLKRPDVTFLQNIAMSFAVIHSAEYANKLLKDGKAALINQHPIGTGPFIFKRYEKDAHIRFVGNKSYWKKGEVKLDSVVFAITPDPSTRIQKLKAGECHITLNPRPADIPGIKNDPKLKVMTQSGFNLSYLAYNVDHRILSIRQVRQALDMAINKKAILEAVYQDTGYAAISVMPPTQWSYNKNLKDAPYNIEKAKQLLAEVGLPQGFTLTLWTLPVQRPYNPDAKLMAAMIQSDWAKIGVKATVLTYEWGEYRKRARNGEHDALLIGWTGDNGDPDNWLGSLLSCKAMRGDNYSKWCDQSFENLIRQAKCTDDIAARTELYRKAQEIVKQQLPLTPIAHTMIHQPMLKTVKGFRVSPFGTNGFSGVSINK